MGKCDKQTVRIVVDMQACQTTGSAQRGVGRYSHALFTAMYEAASPREIHALGATQHPLPLALSGFPQNRQHLIGHLPNFETGRDFEGGEQDSLDSTLLTANISRIKPDIVHISHVFEGYSDRVALPGVSDNAVGPLLSATLYDLIPLRFQEHYFQDARFKRWYLQRLKWLRQADLLLSISESSRQDAIDLLGLDPARIVRIGGGISRHFNPLADKAGARRRLAARYGMKRPNFVLYTGGDDYRKNLQGAIKGYAALRPETRKNTLLVIICAIEPHRIEMYLDFARKSGVERSDLLFVGFVPEDDLVAFYATCDVFVFPSLYEGLGLPVLEAMACGAPVIAGNNSSLLELVPDSDALFDASKPSEIAKKMQLALGNREFAEHLGREGLIHAGKFTWERSARLALDAFDAALRKKQAAGLNAIQNGWLKRQRIAMFTPLPPCRSGIADYNAQFLPFLAEYFDVDLYVDDYKVSDEGLSSSLRIFAAKDFRASASAYDAILYEFGNSEFHVHMLPLLAEFPGIVTLHDAFLSGMMGYLEFNLGEQDRYAQEMLCSHAGQARRYLAPVAAHPNAIGAAMVDLPCTKRVLDQATGLISHSPFNLKVAREFYPEGWLAPYRIIPQMVVTPQRWTQEQIAQTRAGLGFAPDDFILATFGHIAWTKCGDRLLEAFLTSELAGDKRCHLIFAGELAKDDFGLALHDRIRQAGLGQRIRISGFLSDENYARYLRVSDVAVQLRTKSRGGTPKGVLDCLAYGVPVVVNNEASYEDYPDDVVIKLPADPQVADIAAELVGLRADPGRRRITAERGYAYVREYHDPKICAAQYALAIAEFTSRHSAMQTENSARNLAPHLAGCAQPIQAATAAATALDNCIVPSFDKPRLIIDVSHIAKDDHATGIPRVVRNTVRAAYCSARSGLEAVAAELEDGKLVLAANWLARERLLLPFEINSPGQPSLTLRAGDHLLMLDSSWARHDEFLPVFESARAARVPVTTAVYDLLPLTLPPGNIVAGGKEWFDGWLRSAIGASDNLVCISKAVADDLIAFISRNNLGNKKLNIGYWHLGADPPVSGDCAVNSPIHSAQAPFALMVGTIEPRKNHGMALDAFEQLWQQGFDLSLVIAGKPGWMVDDLLKRIRTHELRGKKLWFFESASDAEMNHLYRSAAALLFPSKGEGFGLPLVEAAHHGTPIICSDIPAFREIAGEYAAYVKIEGVEQLAAGISEWRKVSIAGKTVDSRGIPLLTWEKSAEALMDVVLGQKWYWTCGPAGHKFV